MSGEFTSDVSGAGPSPYVDYDGVYLLSHSVGLPFRGTREAIGTAIDVWEQDPVNAWPQWLQTIDGFRDALAQLLRGQASSICPQSNVSSGLTKVLDGLRASFSSDRPKILMSEATFPSLGFVCQQLGYEVRYLNHGDPTDAAHWAADLDGVDLVLITHVHSNTGELQPVSLIAEAARKRGVVSIVDAAQSVGIVPIDLVEWNADVVLGSCVKWLSGGPGAGWLWVHPGMIDRCEPTDVGWFSHPDPFEFDIHRFRYADDALRFWGGSPTILPFAAARHSIENVAALGVPALRQNNLEATQRLIDALGSRVVSPHADTKRGGTCIVAGSPTLAEDLSAVGIHVDQRSNGIRVSPHLHTTAEKMEETLTHLLRLTD